MSWLAVCRPEDSLLCDSAGPCLQCRPERFGSGEYGRSFQMDPLNNMPQWQKQLLSNSFGRDRGDGDRVQAERKAARLQERKEKLAAEFSRRRKSAARSGNRD